MEKMMIVIYNTALESAVMKCIDTCGITCYTKVPRVYGRGETGGPRMGTHVWPGENSMLWIVTGEEKIRALMEHARKLKMKHQGKGVKVFILPVEEKL